MRLVVVERTFEEPQSFDDLQSIEDRFAWCLETNRVVFVKTVFSADRKRMLCFYEAPDVEAVRRAQRTAGMPYDAIYAVSRTD